MKVLLFANTDWYLYNFRLPLAMALREAGYEVVCVSPPGRFGERLRAAGFRWIEFPFSRPSQNPFAELVTMARLCGCTGRSGRPWCITSRSSALFTVPSWRG